MSTTETAITQLESKPYKVFDLDSMSFKTVKVNVDFTAPADVQEAYARLGNDNAVILKALTAALREKALNDARNEAKGNGVPKAAVLKHVNPFRTVVPFNTMVTVERGADGWREQYAKQTDAILEAIRNVPFIMDAIRNEVASWEDESDD